VEKSHNTVEPGVTEVIGDAESEPESLDVIGDDQIDDGVGTDFPEQDGDITQDNSGNNNIESTLETDQIGGANVVDQQDLSENTNEILDDVEVCQKYEITIQDLSYGLTTYTDLKECDSFIVELSPACPGVNPDALTREIPKTDFNWIEDNNSLTFEHIENS